MQNQPIQQVVEALKNANNVMVTVKSSPSVDELTAAVGLTLILNHLNKHATTVFSGKIPSTIEFLQPEMAIESNTDSLRDFIIALDKSKADKLRYKIEDNVVRIFITPYKTSIGQHDLEFSQGEFNVDVVVALGVVDKEDFDQAIVSHGRILHDATIIGVTKGDVISLIGTVNWQDPGASSVSEMISGITDMLGPNVLDGQIATALMTGMVAETDRFRNSNTTPRVLALSSMLMTAGANQQLIASKLEEQIQVTPLVSQEPPVHNPDGMLEIEHEEEEELQDIFIDDHGNMQSAPTTNSAETSVPSVSPATYGMDPVLDQRFAESPSTEEGQQSELPPREYADPVQLPKPEDPPLRNSLFKKHVSNDVSQSAEQQEQQQEQPGDLLNPADVELKKPVLQHNKVIEPLPTDSDENAGKAIQNASAPSNNVATQHKVETSTPQPPMLEDYIGSARPIPPQPQTSSSDNNSPLPAPPMPPRQPGSVDDGLLPPPPTPEQSASSIVNIPMPQEPKIKQKAQDREETIEELEKTIHAPPPEVINPTAPPNNPPPLIPPIPPSLNQPQFFEADGSKSNPFLNPAEKQ